ncbi:MAG: metallophosphoesterase [Candidatus Omnitrophica bacterium]|nr:metallophosphoesterase [Candidatus Omnitrophota bacterium]MBU4590899.1 metallophosphoesterase [Candidatus Omnitrophota bacterium]
MNNGQWTVISRARFLSLALFLFIILMAAPCLADFRFVVMGDSRGRDDGINTEVLEPLLEQVKSEEPEFIVFVGDLITGTKHSDEHRDRLVRWKKIVEKYSIPVHIAVGNHEVTSETSEDILRSLFGELTYSFDHDNAHFVILDTDRYKDFHRLGQEQMEWLKKDLGENKKDVIFVFGHEPAFPYKYHIGDSLDKYPSERDELWDIFKGHGVDAYFCGHEHLYNNSVHDGVSQIITGGAGARPHASPEDGGFYHYIVVDVTDSGEYTITVKRLNFLL